jgi:hypothetical protein
MLVIYIFCFVWMKCKKKVVSDRFAECCTRQWVPLPSAIDIAFDKYTMPGHLKNSTIEIRLFA